MEQYDANGNGEAMYYDRDVSGNIVARYGQDINNWAFTARGDLYYGYTGSGSSFVRNASWEIVEKTVHLAGGLLLTIKPKETLAANQKQYSANSVLGRTLLTTNASGTNTSTGIGPASTFAYDPFGNMVAGSNRPANTVSGSYGYGGTLQKMTEVNLALAPIQMGARVYLPTIGRFTSLDPIPGGNANNYVYVLDPINGNDYSGMASCNAMGCSISWGGGSLQGSSPQLQGSVNRVQVTVNSSRIQSSSARVHATGGRLQSPGRIVAAVSVRPKAVTPTVYPHADPSIISKLGSSMKSAATTFVSREVNGFKVLGEKAWNNPITRGCGLSIASNLALAGGVAAAGGQVEISAGILATACVVGAATEFAKSRNAPGGIMMESTNSAMDAYEVYTLNLML